jgi:putative ABC transport system ATP-binding protein
MGSIIEINGVTKDYPLGKTTVHALRGVDVNVEEGELLSIVGASGSGKTTLLNIMDVRHPKYGKRKDHGEEIPP